MDVLDAIKGRRSIRAFKSGKDVSEKTVEELIIAAQWAPSAGNIQPWEFIVVRTLEIKKRLTEAAFNQSFMEEAPVVIVVCTDENRSSEGYGQRGRTLYCLQDTAAATQNMHLAAYSTGLGTCWVGAFKEEEVREILNIPNGIRPVALIPIGYASEAPAARRKRAIKELVHNEVFQQDKTHA
jgi:nitroreductase